MDFDNCSEISQQQFQTTDLYKDIQQLTTMPKDSPINLEHALQQRERGVASAFLASYQRYLRNAHIPNKLMPKDFMPMSERSLLSKFNRSGSQLLIVCQDGPMKIFDASMGPKGYPQLHQFEAGPGPIGDGDFSPNGQYLACIISRRLCLLPVSGPMTECHWINLPDVDQVNALRFSPSGDRILCGSNSSSISVTDVKTQATSMTVNSHNAYLNALCYISSSDPNLVFAGYADGQLKMFDLRSPNAVLSFSGHLGGITSIDPRNDGNHVLSSSSNEIVKIWDIRQSSIQRDHLSREYPPSIMTYYGQFTVNKNFCAKFSPREQTGQQFIYMGCASGCIPIYDVLTGKIKNAIQGQNPCVLSMDWHPVRPEIVFNSKISSVEVIIHDCELDK